MTSQSLLCGKKVFSMCAMADRAYFDKLGVKCKATAVGILKKISLMDKQDPYKPR